MFQPECALYFPRIFLEKEKTISRLLISDYFLKWATYWCNCNNNKKTYSWINISYISDYRVLKLRTWMAPAQRKTCISVFKAVHFPIFPESVFFFQTSASFPVQHEPWKLSLSLPLADNPHQNSCTHKTLTTSWLAVIQLFEWTAVGEQSLEHGEAWGLFANVAHQLLLSVVFAGKAWKSASCSRNRRTWGISEALPFTPVCQHLTPFAVECFP